MLLPVLLLGFSDILSTFDDPEGAVLGTCGSIEEIMIGEDKVIQFSGSHRPGLPQGEYCRR